MFLSSGMLAAEGIVEFGFHLGSKRQGEGPWIWVQEPDGPIPSWEAVQREEPLGDIAAILRRTGLRFGELSSTIERQGMSSIRH